ncbi:MAG: T9SS type A sorting domain-containing protein [Sphingobacteriales bacterium]|nr:T9SS type A sorting domain-containing protein [Sphingobacteriales bacterium]
MVYNVIHAQNIKSSAVTTSGATMNQSNAKLSFTVGEIVVKTITDGNNSIGQGFINSSTSNVITAIKEPDLSKLQMKVYPNPSSDLIYVDISDSKVSDIQLSVYDITGKQISNAIYIAGNNHIGVNTQSWQKGEYIITIRDTHGDQLGSYKIVRL